MIAFLEGTIEYKSPNMVLLNVGGIGYEINISTATYDKLPKRGDSVKMYIVETVGLYGGITTFYGFISLEEKDIFISFKEGLKSTGAKKSLDYLDKAMKSLPDFHRAVMNKDIRLLTSIFGFRSKTAEKIVTSLKDKFAGMKIPGKEKWSAVTGGNMPSEAIQALVALGYRESQARNVIEKVISGLDKVPKTEELIKLALKHL